MGKVVWNTYLAGFLAGVGMTLGVESLIIMVLTHVRW